MPPPTAAGQLEWYRDKLNAAYDVAFENWNDVVHRDFFDEIAHEFAADSNITPAVVGIAHAVAVAQALARSSGDDGGPAGPKIRVATESGLELVEELQGDARRCIRVRLHADMPLYVDEWLASVLPALQLEGDVSVAVVDCTPLNWSSEHSGNDLMGHLAHPDHFGDLSNADQNMLIAWAERMPPWLVERVFGGGHAVAYKTLRGVFV